MAVTSLLDTDVRQEESLLLQFIYQCPVGLAELDNLGNIRLLNALGVALLMPIAITTALGNFFDLLRPHAPRMVEQIETSPLLGEIFRNQRILFQQPGAAIHLSFTAIRLDANTLMIALDDVTTVVEAERRTREALDGQAIQAGRVEMAATVLHDIGNAVTGIGTRSAQLLADPPWPEIDSLSRMSFLLQSQTALLATVLGEKKALALGGLASALERSLRQRELGLREHVRALASSVSHVQEILSVQRQYVHQRGMGPRSPVVLAELLHDAIALQSAGLQKRAIRVVRRLSPDLPTIVLDRTRMVQVIGNLIRNACESFDESKVGMDDRRLEVLAEKVKPGWVRLTFRDGGNGFPSDQAESLFERGATTKSHGSGLGLASCRNTVESHGGRIWIESSGVGQGATVTIDLPTHHEEDQNA
jgi:signal transduction histidine kinase